MAQRIGKADFGEKVKEQEGLVLVDFYSDSCIPCKQLSPILGDIEDSYESKVKVYKVNVNYEADLAADYSVMGAPTLILFQNGEVLDTKRGLVKKDVLKEWLESYLN